MTGLNSVIADKTEGTSSFLKYKKINVTLNYNLIILKFAFFSD